MLIRKEEEEKRRVEDENGMVRSSTTLSYSCNHIDLIGAELATVADSGRGAEEYIFVHNGKESRCERRDTSDHGGGISKLLAGASSHLVSIGE